MQNECSLALFRESLDSVLLNRGVIKIKEMTPRALANILWGFATLEFSGSPKARAELCAAAVSQSPEMSASELSITAWSLGTLRAVGHLEDLAAVLSTGVVVGPGPLAAKEVANLVWGLSHARLHRRSVPAGVLALVQGCLRELAEEAAATDDSSVDLRALAMLARGLLKLRLCDEFGTLLDQALRSIPELSPESGPYF